MLECRYVPAATNWLPIDINSELDELDREEFYRLKKVCIMLPFRNINTLLTSHDKVANKKQRDTAAADAEMKARRAAQQKNDEPENDKEDIGPSDILAVGDDEDVIF
jgi:V-type H+-transporting ATPase subunit D